MSNIDFSSPTVVLVGVVLAVLLIALALFRHHQKWNCPECGQTMQMTGKKGGFMWRNEEMRCPSCGHTKWYKPPWTSGD